MREIQRCLFETYNKIRQWCRDRIEKRRNIKKFSRFLTHYRNWDSDYLYLFLFEFLTDIRQSKYTIETLTSKEVRKLDTCIELAKRLSDGNQGQEKFSYKLHTFPIEGSENMIVEVETTPLYDFPVNTSHIYKQKLPEQYKILLFRLVQKQMHRWWN